MYYLCYAIVGGELLALVAMVGFIYFKGRGYAKKQQPAVEFAKKERAIRVAVEWWQRTIAAIARSENRPIKPKRLKRFGDQLGFSMAAQFLREGHYYSLSTGKRSLVPLIETALEYACIPAVAVPADVSMVVYPDAVGVRCGLDEDNRHVDWLWRK